MNLEHASMPTTTRSTTEATILRAPPAIRAAINRNRQTRGLAPVVSEVEVATATKTSAPEPRGCGVWINGPDGTLIPATARSRIIPAARRSSPMERPPLATRVMLAVAYGDAAAADVRSRLPETIGFRAFGSADELNRDGGWTLQDGHHGTPFATAGRRLRAHDTSAGLIVEWLPNMTLSYHRELVKEIERGRTALSVAMKIGESRTIRVPQPTRMIRSARLMHVALLREGERGCYPGARAKVFHCVRPDDADEFRRNVDETIERARWHARRARLGR